MSNFTKIRPVGDVLTQADGRTDRQTDRETDRHGEASIFFYIYVNAHKKAEFIFGNLYNRSSSCLLVFIRILK